LERNGFKVKHFIEAGRLNSPRGIKGEIRFTCYCDSPEFLRGVKTLYLDEKGEKSLEVVSYRPTIPTLIFKGYESRENAYLLAGRTVYFNRNDVALPDRAFYFCDLIGEDAYDGQTGKKIGVVKDVEEISGKFYYIITGEKSYRVPAVEDFVPFASPGEGVKVKGIEELEI